jgi:hypothetical protein
MAWQSPTVTVKWGSYFQPDAADEKTIVDMVVAATPYITKRVALEKLAPIFGIENVEAALEELEGEQAAAADDEAQRAQDELAAAHALTNGTSAKPGGARPGSGSDPKKAPGGGSVRAPAPKPKA